MVPLGNYFCKLLVGRAASSPREGASLAAGSYNPQAVLDIVNKWYKKLLSSAVAFVNREEIRNLIRNELVDFFPLADWFCKLLDHSCNRTKYFQCPYWFSCQEIIWENTQLMWSAAALLGFVNLVNREEIPNLITNQSVELVSTWQLPQ